MQFSLSYASLTRRALFTVAGGILVLFVIVTIISGQLEADSLVFVGPVIVIPAVVGFALGRWSGKLHILSAIAGILLIVFTMPPAALFNLTSTVEFLFTAILFFGGIVVVVSSVMAFLGRKAETPPVVAPALQYAVLAAIVVPAIAAVIGLIGWIAGGSDISDADKAGAVAVSIKEFDFKPDEVAASGKLIVSNDDFFHHRFTVEELDIDLDINPGRSVLVDVSNEAPGTYDITCSIEGHEAMDSKLVLSR